MFSSKRFLIQDITFRYIVFLVVICLYTLRDGLSSILFCKFGFELITQREEQTSRALRLLQLTTEEFADCSPRKGTHPEGSSFPELRRLRCNFKKQARRVSFQDTVLKRRDLHSVYTDTQTHTEHSGKLQRFSAKY